jgi:hypothetical protein
MLQPCAMLSSCGFFKKYHGEKNLACKGFINKYCLGPQKSACKRKEFREQHGVSPPDDMMPGGQMMASHSLT